MKITGIILAGGKSNRMGTNKALLELGGLTLIERVARVLSGTCSEIIIAGGGAKELAHLGYQVVPDIYSGCGPLSGIHAGLTAARNRYSFVAACDIPFLDEKLIYRLVSEAEGYDAVILKHGDYFEPLSSLYSKALIEAAETSIKKGVYKVTAVLSLVKWKPVTVDSASIPDLEKSLFNINTPRDYENAKKLRDD
ncbi:MAG: molybdenum cofactor guanylyltransferase [Peptococcaceae bacterium]|nr:molybdenum cofactor guanylyltransferase [Peptococcaceae bacterium]